MLLGKYYITSHALRRYNERVNYIKEQTTRKSIEKDLRTLNIRYIIRTDCKVYVFTKNSKEFIFTKGDDGLYLKTIIKRNREDTIKTIHKRKNLACN